MWRPGDKDAQDPRPNAEAILDHYRREAEQLLVAWAELSGQRLIKRATLRRVTSEGTQWSRLDKQRERSAVLPPADPQRQAA